MSDPDSITLPLKTCTKCGRDYPATLEFFQARAGSKLHSWCKECMSAYHAAYNAEHREERAAYKAAYYAARREEIAADRADHREERAAYDAVYRAEHRDERAAYFAAYRAEHREELAAYGAAYNADHRDERAALWAAYYAAHRDEIAAYYVAHREEKAAYQAAYNVTHREKRLAYSVAYGADHPEGRAVRERNRRARKKGNGGTHTADDVRAQYARQHGKCYWCEKKLDRYHVDHVMPVILGGSNGPENLVIACPTCNLRKGGMHPMDFSGRLL